MSDFHKSLSHLTDAWAIIKISGRQHRWLAGGYDLEIEVDGMVVSWIVAFLPSVYTEQSDQTVTLGSHKQLCCTLTSLTVHSRPPGVFVARHFIFGALNFPFS